MARTPRDADDEAPWLAEGVREAPATLVPRARLVGGTLIVVLLAVLVALGVYLASGHKSDGSAGYARPEDAPLVAADAGPYKLSPTDPGGAQITGIDDSVATVAGGADTGSALAPDAAEEPLARPGTTPPGTTPPGTTTAPPVAAPVAPAPPPAPPTDLLPAMPPARTTAPAPTVAPKAAAAAKPAPKSDVTPAVRADMPQPVRPKPVKTLDPLAAGSSDAPAPTTKPQAEAASPDAAPKTDTQAKHDAPAKRDAAAKHDAAAKRDAAPTDVPARADAPATGSVALQLGAFSTREKAEAAWTAAGGDGALSGLGKRIEPVDRAGVTLYRLRAAGVASKDAARALCGRIRAAGNACVVAE